MPLALNNICKSFGEKPVLSDFSMRAEEGERVCILGPSGGGKTTLLNIIAGLILPTAVKLSCPKAEYRMCFRNTACFPGLPPRKT